MTEQKTTGQLAYENAEVEACKAWWIGLDNPARLFWQHAAASLSMRECWEHKKKCEASGGAPTKITQPTDGMVLSLSAAQRAAVLSIEPMQLAQGKSKANDYVALAQALTVLKVAVRDSQK